MTEPLHKTLNPVEVATEAIMIHEPSWNAAYDRMLRFDGLQAQVPKRLAAEIERLQACERALEEPIPMLLFCPDCGARHVDQGEWATRPHRTHLCACGHKWRPCERPTVGVETLTAIAAVRGEGS